jgi:hypothetical protein
MIVDFIISSAKNNVALALYLFVRQTHIRQRSVSCQEPFLMTQHHIDKEGYSSGLINLIPAITWVRRRACRPTEDTQ